MINNSRISKLLSKVNFAKPTDDKAVRKLFEAQEGGEKYNYVPKSRVGYRTNPDGTKSTHLMAREYIPGKGWVVFPTLYQNSNNEWIDMGEIHGVNWWPIYEYAQQVGELYEFGEDEEDAINFADKGSWKENMNKRPFFKTRLSPADELRFQKFFKTLPENLQTDDDLYDIRGYWDAEGKPDEFDYSQEKQEDGFYHAYSRHPYTGKILKSPAHPTFQEAMENETHKRVDVYGNIYTGLPKFQEAGNVMDKDGYIDIEKHFGINPLSEDGLVLVQQLHKEYPDAKFICTAQGCAQIASDAAAASGNSFSRGNAWDIGNRNSVDYTNPAYEGQIGQGALPDPDWNRQFPQEIFTAGNMVGLNRYNSESSYHYADQEEFPGSRGYEHVGYMIDDNTLLHGTGATGEHPAYFILDNVSDNRIKLPHYGSYEPVESIAPAGYLKSMGNFAGDVASYMGFEEGGQFSNHRFQDGGANQEYLDQLAAYNWGLQEFAKKYYTEGEYTQEMLEQDYQGLAEHPAPWNASNNIYAVDKELSEKSGFNRLNATPCGASYHCAAPAYDTVPVFKKPEKPADMISAESSVLENKNPESINYRPPRKGLFEVDKSTGRFIKNSRKEGGNISQMGYRDDSPYKDRDYIDIETENGLIDMSQTGQKLLATDLETGEQRVLQPYSGLHKFTGKIIREKRMEGEYQDGGMTFNSMDSNTKLVRQRNKKNGDVVSIVIKKSPGQGFSRYKITTRNGEVIKVSEIHGQGGFEDEDYVPYTPDEMYMQQNQFEIRPEPNSQNKRNINNFEINKKNGTRML